MSESMMSEQVAFTHPTGHRARISVVRGLMACLCLLAMMATPCVWATGTAPDKPVDVPALRTWVTDQTGILNPETQQALNTRLAKLEQDKGAQLAVLVVPTTGQDTIEDYARRVFDQWRLGRAKVDDGALLVVALQDRRLRVEVGYGLEGAISDLQAGRIIREHITPYFKEGDYIQGITAGVDSLEALIRGEALPAPAATSSSTSDNDEPLAILLPLAFFSLVLPVIPAAVASGAFVYLAFDSLFFAIVAALVAAYISVLGRRLRAGGRGATRAARRGGVIGGFGGGFAGGGGGGHGGGMGSGGGVSGGGGGSGGGGASGGW